MVPLSSAGEDAAEVRIRLVRIKALCDRLLTEQTNSGDARALAERIYAEVEAARAALKAPDGCLGTYSVETQSVPF